MINLSGQNALIIGEMNQLAEGVASSLALAGADIFVAHKAGSVPPSWDDLQADLTIQAMDFSNPELLTKQMATLPALHTIVINPGWFAHTPFLEATPEDIEHAVTQNYEQATNIIQAAARHFIQHQIPGSIIMLSSVVSLMPFVHTNLAGSTLAALEVVTKMAAVDLGQYGIRVNIVAAGWLDDERSLPLLTENGQLHTPEDIPLRAIGQTQDVGNVCCFLASELSGYITGTVLPVDGGFLLTKSAAQTPYSTSGEPQ